MPNLKSLAWMAVVAAVVDLGIAHYKSVKSGS